MHQVVIPRARLGTGRVGERWRGDGEEEVDYVGRHSAVEGVVVDPARRGALCAPRRGVHSRWETRVGTRRTSGDAAGQSPPPTIRGGANKIKKQNL